MDILARLNAPAGRPPFFLLILCASDSLDEVRNRVDLEGLRSLVFACEPVWNGFRVTVKWI